MRGLRGKALYLSSLECDYDVICFTETWLLSGTNNRELLCVKFTVFISDRDYEDLGMTRGGSILIALSASGNKCRLPQRYQQLSRY